jgi:hypothetical protein
MQKTIQTNFPKFKWSNHLITELKLFGIWMSEFQIPTVCGSKYQTSYLDHRKMS